MNATEKAAPTEAEKWMHSLRLRTAHITSLEQVGAAVRIVDDLDAEYPNQLFRLTDSKSKVEVGMRRVFGDRSYCDHLHENASIGRIVFGTMSKGMLGEAQNGRIIMGAGHG